MTRKECGIQTTDQYRAAFVTESNHASRTIIVIGSVGLWGTSTIVGMRSLCDQEVAVE